MDRYMNIKTIYIILISSVIILCLLPGYAFAGLVVTPDRHIVYLSPGEDKVVMYHVENSSNEDIDITIEPKSWSGPADPYQWLSLESDNIYVNSGESTPFTVKLNVPEKAEGEMVAMLFLCYKENSQSQLNIRNGVPIYVIVKDTEEYGLDIENIDISYARKLDFYDLTFAVKIRNTGNIHIIPDVSIVVRDEERKIINTISLKRPNIVLRDKTHIYRLIWREPDLKDGIYTATAALDYEDKIALQAKDIGFKVSGNRIDKIDTVNTGD
jgi:uncharacterized membrane protein